MKITIELPDEWDIEAASATLVELAWSHNKYADNDEDAEKGLCWVWHLISLNWLGNRQCPLRTLF